jgi:hypothetical protein
MHLRIVARVNVHIREGGMGAPRHSTAKVLATVSAANRNMMRNVCFRINLVSWFRYWKRVLANMRNMIKFNQNSELINDTCALDHISYNMSHSDESESADASAPCSSSRSAATITASETSSAPATAGIADDAAPDEDDAAQEEDDASPGGDVDAVAPDEDEASADEDDAVTPRSPVSD